MADTQWDSIHQGWSSYWCCQMFNLRARDHCCILYIDSIPTPQGEKPSTWWQVDPSHSRWGSHLSWLELTHIMTIGLAFPACRSSAVWSYEGLQSVRPTDTGFHVALNRTVGLYSKESETVGTRSGDLLVLSCTGKVASLIEQLSDMLNVQLRCQFGDDILWGWGTTHAPGLQDTS